MKFWNTETGDLLNSVNTESQVSSLVWNRNDKEIVSSHGYTDNQLCVWKILNQPNQSPQATKIAELRGHTQRILSMSASPDGTTLCSASADETLRFWKVFGSRSTGHPAGNQEGNFLYADNCFLR
jgi:cell division cycle protein 20 (cofactor of APC complex)